MVRLHSLGWGSRRLSQESGCTRNTVRRYLRASGAVPFQKPERRTAFDGLEDWLRQRFFRRRGDADVVRQELENEHRIRVCLRSVKSACRLASELTTAHRATLRFETRVPASNRRSTLARPGVDRGRMGAGSSVRRQPELFATDTVRFATSRMGRTGSMRQRLATPSRAS